MGGSTEIFRSNEVQVEQISFGGDFHWQNVRGRILTMNGMFGVTTPRNDASAGRGQWDLRGAYKYVSEAYGGYHFNVNHGLNVDAGIFVSYIGLFSYYNFDNWAYQPSYVSSNTPWFFNGLRIQWFPTDKLKIEPWIINGWQSYGRLGSKPGLGGQILYRPKPWLSLVFNNYGMGEDTLGNGDGHFGRSRIHTDDSVEVKYYDHPEKFLDKMAFSFTGDLGCEYGGSGTFVSAQGRAINNNVNCHHNTATSSKQTFAGWMLYNRWWFKKDTYGITIGGGAMDNPGRYLTLLPPINGADAITGSPYFTQNPGDPYKAWDAFAHLRLDAQTVHHVPCGVRISPRERAVLDGSWRDHAPAATMAPQHGSESRCRICGGKHYIRAGPVPVRHAWLHLCGWKHGFLPRPAEGRTQPEVRDHGEVLVWATKETRRRHAQHEPEQRSTVSSSCGVAPFSLCSCFGCAAGTGGLHRARRPGGGGAAARERCAWSGPRPVRGGSSRAVSARRCGGASTTSELVVTGTVTPDIARNVPVVSLASGRVVAIHARLGDTVKKGQLLLTIRSDDVAGGFDAYRKAVADELLARKQLNRAMDLYAHGAIAQQDLEVAQDAADDAKVTLDDRDRTSAPPGQRSRQAHGHRGHRCADLGRDHRSASDQRGDRAGLLIAQPVYDFRYLVGLDRLRRVRE